MPRRPARSPLAEEVFSEAGPVGDAFSEFSGSAELRSRAARIDIGRLPAARLDIAQGRAAHLNLNLFADADMEAVLERAVPSASGYSLTGRLADDPLSTVVLTVGDGLVVGTVWGRDGMYEIRSAGGAGEVRQLDPSGLPRCGLGTAPLGGSLEASASEHLHHAATGSSSGSRAAVDHRRPLTSIPPPMAPVGPSPQPLQADDGDVIDLLVVYPEFERRRTGHGSHRNMRALIEHGVALTNEAYRASGVMHRVALVAAVEVDYGAAAQRTSHEDLAALADPSDGAMDEVHKLRDSYAADIVALYVRGIFARAFALDPSSEGAPPFAFLRSTENSLAHELGHIMGLAHSWRDDFWEGVYPYSTGHVLDLPDQGASAGTIMAGKRVNRFSNPRRKYPDDESGVPLGVPGDEWPNDPNARTGPADAVRSMNETRRMVANFRASAARCEYSLTAEAGPMPAAGGSFKVRIETAPDCFWNAWAEDGFISVLGASSGTGSGEVTYQVRANDHWPREGAIAAAGKVHAVKQLGGRPMTPVGERLDKIQRILQYNLVDGTEGTYPIDPEDITSADLANLRELYIGERWELDTLRPGDLEGLSNLTNLHISSPSLVLRPGAFDGLSNLANLNIRAPSLALHPGVFGGLLNLANISLDSPSLVLHPGTFDGLSNLSELDISSSPAILGPGMFDGLSNLHSLSLYLALGPRTNMPVTIPAGVFAGLSNLNYLSFTAHPLEIRRAMFSGLTNLSIFSLRYDIAELRRGMFEGLANLQILYLDENYLENIEPGAFEGLSNLRILRLDSNELTTLRPGWASGLSSLEQLFLSDNYFTHIPPLQGLENVTFFGFSRNFVSDIEPFLAYDWLGDLDLVNVSSNPLSQKSLTTHIPALEGRGVQVVATPNFSILSTIVEEGRSADFEVSLLPRAPIDMTVPWTLVRGSAKAGEDYDASIPDGELTFRSGETHKVLSVSTIDDNLVELDENFSVNLHDPIPTPSLERFIPRGVGLLTFPSYAIGIIRDDDLMATSGESIAIDLVDGFRPPRWSHLNYNSWVSLSLVHRWSSNGLADGPLTYQVKSADPNVARAAVQDGVAVISANGPGMTTVTVTAADSYGQTATRTFVVTVKPSPKGSLWDGWRSVLLRSSPDEADAS